MSATTIPAAKVVAVLLADGWHHVVQGSFTVGTLGFGADADPDVLGFRFEEADTASPYRRPAALAGPLGSIIAVRQVTFAARQLSALDSLTPGRARTGPQKRYRGEHHSSLS